MVMTIGINYLYYLSISLPDRSFKIYAEVGFNDTECILQIYYSARPSMA